MFSDLESNEFLEIENVSQWDKMIKVTYLSSPISTTLFVTEFKILNYFII